MKHTLTDEERLRGVEASLSSSRTPQSLKSGLRQYRDQLRAKIGMSPRRKRSRSSGSGNFLRRFLQL